MTEPQAGSDLAGLRSRAVRDGDGWVLNGAKTFITNGTAADLVVVAARTGEGRKDVSLFLLDGDAEGFERGRKLEKVGQHEADTAELFFEDVRLPAGALIGEEGRGFAYMMERLPQERLSVAVANVAHAAAALEVTLVYVKERRAFGQPIGTFQHSRFLLAEMQTEIDAARAFVDQCVMAHVEGELSAVDAAKAKWWTADVQNRILDRCVQLHGGYGYMDEYAVARFWADGRVTQDLGRDERDHEGPDRPLDGPLLGARAPLWGFPKSLRITRAGAPRRRNTFEPCPRDSTGTSSTPGTTPAPGRPTSRPAGWSSPSSTARARRPSGGCATCSTSPACSARRSSSAGARRPRRRSSASTPRSTSSGSSAKARQAAATAANWRPSARAATGSARSPRAG